MLTPEELTALRAKAEAATPGPWDSLTDETYIWERIKGGCIGECYRANDKDFICAANPDTILQLLDRIDFLEKEVVSYKWVAQQAWGGEIPSPYPCHNSSYEKFIESMEHHNCPCCGGSGHVDDCDKDLADKIERLEKEADWLAIMLIGRGHVIGDPKASLAELKKNWREYARNAVEKDND